MHKEIKQGKKTVAIIISLLTITVALYIYQFSKMTLGRNVTIKFILEALLIMTTLIVLFIETRKCKIAYKYCIISDKLIINKINSKNEENVESLKIKDIIYIGEKVMFLKSIVDVNVVGTILENLIRQKNYYVYIKKKGKYINLF